MPCGLGQRAGDTWCVITSLRVEAVILLMVPARHRAGGPDVAAVEQRGRPAAAVAHLHDAAGAVVEQPRVARHCQLARLRTACVAPARSETCNFQNIAGCSASCVDVLMLSTGNDRGTKASQGAAVADSLYGLFFYTREISRTKIKCTHAAQQSRYSRMMRQKHTLRARL